MVSATRRRRPGIIRQLQAVTASDAKGDDETLELRRERLLGRISESERLAEIDLDEQS